MSSLNGASAWRAADAREAAIMQGVVGQLECLHILLHFVLGPVEKRTHLVETVAVVPLDRLTLRAKWRLFAPHAGDPRLTACNGAPERFDLADVAAAQALIDARVETVDAVLGDEALDVLRLRVINTDTFAVAALHAIE